MIKIFIEDWGIIDYELAWARQLTYLGGANNRVYFIFCEHPRVITVGRGTGSLLLKSEELIFKKKIPLLYVDRGGNITAHFPGQLMVYVLFSLKEYKLGLRQWLEIFEDLIFSTIKMWLPNCYKEKRGVWTQEGKIASFGIAARKFWVYHGCSINYNLDQEINNLIYPCGIKGAQFSAINNFLKNKIFAKDIIYQISERLIGLFYSFGNEKKLSVSSKKLDK